MTKEFSLGYKKLPFYFSIKLSEVCDTFKCVGFGLWISLHLKKCISVSVHLGFYTISFYFGWETIVSAYERFKGKK